jgi:hypothetical protein
MTLQKNTLYYAAGILFIATLIFGFLFLQKRAEAPTTAAGTERMVTDETYGISFRFKEGPDAFTLVEPPEGQAGIQKAYVLLPTGDFNTYKESEDAREAPAGMQLFIFAEEPETDDETASGTERLDRMTRLKNWAVERDSLTQFTKASTEPEVVEIDGLKALKYKADGLYQQTVYLASYKNRIYMFVSQYNDPTDSTALEFEPLIESISFN